MPDHAARPPVQIGDLIPDVLAELARAALAVGQDQAHATDDRAKATR